MTRTWVLVGLLVVGMPSLAQALDTQQPLRMTLSLLGGGADTVSTLYALDRGAVEANPLMRPLVQHPPVLLVAQTGVSMAIAKCSDMLAKRGKKKTAMAVAVGYFALKVGIAAHNVRVGMREGRR